MLFVFLLVGKGVFGTAISAAAVALSEESRQTLRVRRASGQRLQQKKVKLCTARGKSGEAASELRSWISDAQLVLAVPNRTYMSYGRQIDVISLKSKPQLIYDWPSAAAGGPLSP